MLLTSSRIQIMSDELQHKLSVVRTEIDSIDGQLLDLLNRRARCAQLDAALSRIRQRAAGASADFGIDFSGGQIGSLGHWQWRSFDLAHLHCGWLFQCSH